jgi:IS30 family transposase
VYATVFAKLRSGWSPEQIAGRLKLEQGHPVICPETIYQFVYQEQNREKQLWEFLPRHQKKRRKQTGRSVQKVRIPQRVSIHRRPELVDQRTAFGHWEGDTVEGKRSEGDGIHTEVERQTRFLLARKVDRIASPETIRAQLWMFRRLPDTARQSTTVDNGREQHRHVALHLLGMTTFFCDPYSSWQRGTNENTNGLVRRYIPKQTSLKDLSQEDLDDIVEELNNRPRKCLGYNTPKEEFERQLQWCT